MCRHHTDFVCVDLEAPHSETHCRDDQSLSAPILTQGPTTTVTTNDQQQKPTSHQSPVTSHQSKKAQPLSGSSPFAAALALAITQ
jgi:hypothetical protein